jgi:hypothetical protein
MDLVFDERSANSSFVEIVWHTRGEGAGTFTSVAVSNWRFRSRRGWSRYACPEVRAR